MSQENVEVVRAAYDAFERGDLEAVSRLHDPAIEWHTSVEDPDAAIHRGPVAVRRYFEGYIETFPGLRTSSSASGPSARSRCGAIAPSASRPAAGDSPRTGGPSVGQTEPTRHTARAG
jgi:SnoaL-like domain